MRKILPLFLLLSSALLAQFPGSVASDSTLKVARNRIQTTLASPVSSLATSFQVSSSSGIVPNMTLTIEDEIVSVCSVVGSTVTVGVAGCPNFDGRGVDNTVPNAHAAGKAVSGFVVALHHNVLKQEIIAIENALGANMQNVASAGSQPAHYFLAGPPSGTQAPSAFRPLDPTDLPGTLTSNTTGTASGFTGSLAGDIVGTQGATQVARINGVVPAASATVDTTNAANISSGTLPAARLPLPTALTIGGIKAQNCSGGGQFVQVIGTDGSVTCGTPAGGGNVSGPGAVTNGFLAQWGASSNLLTTGLPVSATPAANTVVLADGGGKINVGYIPAYSGDVSSSGVTLTLATVNASPGSCGDSTHVCQIATDNKGRITTQLAIAISGATFGNQAANSVFAGPTTGSPATPGFRALVSADIPNNAANTTGTAAGITGMTLSGTGSILLVGSGTFTNGNCLAIGAGGVMVDNGSPCGSGGGGGTVTSVAMTAPAIFSVAGSPVTTTGTLALSLATQAANLVWAGPTTGAASAPTFRSLVLADIPTGYAYSNLSGAPTLLTSVALSMPAMFNVSGSPVTGAGGTLTATLANQNANLVFAGPTTGAAAAPTFRALAAADIPTGYPYANLSGAPTLRYQQVQTNTSNVAQRLNLNFSTDFTLSDNAGTNTTTVALASPGGGGSPGGVNGNIQYRVNSTTFGGLDPVGQVLGAINVKAPTAVGGCGLAGDGTTDDTTAFNTCITNNGSGANYRFPPGVYVLGGVNIGNGNSTTTHSSLNNISIEGAGGGMDAAGTSPGFSNVVIWKYPGTGATGSGTYVVRTKGGVNNISIRGVQIDANNRAYRGLWVDSCSGCDFSRLMVMKAAGDYQVYVNSTMNSVSVGNGCFTNFSHIQLFGGTSHATGGVGYDSTVNSGGTADSCSNYWDDLKITAGGLFPNGQGIAIDNTDNLYITRMTSGVLDSLAVSSVSVSSGTANVTTSSAHNMPTNAAVWIGGATDERISGNHWATSTGSNTFSFATSAPNGTYTATYVQPVTMYVGPGAWSITVSQANMDAGAHWQNTGFNPGSVTIDHYMYESGGIIHPGDMGLRTDDFSPSFPNAAGYYYPQPLILANNKPLKSWNQAGTSLIPLVDLTTSNDLALQTGGWFYFRNSSGTAALTLKDDGTLVTPKLAGSATQNVCADTAGTLMVGTCAPVASAYNSTDQSISDSTFTPVNFDSEDIDTGANHSTVTNDKWIIVQAGQAGPWACVGQVAYGASPSGLRLTRIVVRPNQSGGTVIAQSTITGQDATRATTQNLSAVYNASVNDAFELSAYQESGGALAATGGRANTFLQCHRIGQ